MLTKRVRQGCFRLQRNLKYVGVIDRCFSNRWDNLDNMETLSGGLTRLPPTAKVVICGGGIMGTAVAYHLAKRGWGGQTVLIEKEK